jgi:hypothetical protein
LVALVALLLLVGLAGCGGGADSDSTAAKAGAGGSAEGRSSAGASKQDGAKGGGDGKSSEGPDGKQRTASGGDASDFKPKRHEDSGSGAEQFEVKGGDNSIQEFGEEAGPSELDAAATALHNFLDARAEGNWAATCQYLAKSTIESLEKLASQAKQLEDRGCGGILATLINPAARASMKVEAEKADVSSLRVEGEQAFVIYTGAESTVLAVSMAKEAGTWKVAGLAGTPLN